MRGTATCLCLMLGLGLGVSSCADGITARPDEVVVGTAVDIEGVNPLTAGASRIGREVTDRMFLRLFEEQPDFAAGPPTFLPALARRWTWSGDRTRLRLELDSDAVWSDGTPVTSADVVWTWRRQIDPAVAWPHASSKDGIAHMRAVGPHVVVVRFREPSANAMAELNEGPILPRHVWSRLEPGHWRHSGDWFLRHLVVSGPFRLAGWQPGHEVRLVPNPRFRGDRPEIGALRLRVLPHPATRLLELTRGGVDLLDSITPEEARRLAKQPDIVVDRAPSRRFTFLCWNLRHPFLGERIVREALTLGIDRAGLTRDLLGLFGRIGTSPIPSSVWAHDRSLRPRPFDPERARRRLAEAGFRDTNGDGIVERDGRPLRFELSTNSDNAMRRDALVHIQRHLRTIGVEAEIRLDEFNALLDRNLAGEFDATLGAWAIDTSLDLGWAFHSDSIGGYNYGAYANPEVDRAIERARRRRHPRRRKDDLVLVQRLLDRDLPYTFLWETDHLSARRARLTGVRAGPMGTLFRARDWRWDA